MADRTPQERATAAVAAVGEALTMLEQLEESLGPCTVPQRRDARESLEFARAKLLDLREHVRAAHPKAAAA